MRYKSRMATGTQCETGHVVGRTYLDALSGETYTVEAVVTLWECAPDEAVRVRWSNGNVTLRSQPRGADREIGRPPVAA
jgi:hypothetical protein